jgi:hypothetical protein
MKQHGAGLFAIYATFDGIQTKGQRQPKWTILRVIHRSIPLPRNERCLDDLPGDDCHDMLNRLRTALNPRTYFKIGIETGKTLALVRRPSIAADLQFYFADLSCVQRVLAKPSVMFFRTTSDDFFPRFRPDVLLGQPVDFAFLDGMHRCEYLPRDFINTERCCRKRRSLPCMTVCPSNCR